MKKMLTNLRTTSHHLQTITIMCGICMNISSVKVLFGYRKWDTRISRSRLGKGMGWKGYSSWFIGHTTRSKRMVLSIIVSR